MAETMLEEDGHLLLPQEIREHLHLHPGDRLNIVIQNNRRCGYKIGWKSARCSGFERYRLFDNLFNTPPSKPVSIEYTAPSSRPSSVC